MLRLSFLFTIIAISSLSFQAQCDTLNYSNYFSVFCIDDTVTIPNVIVPSGRGVNDANNQAYLPDGNGQNYIDSQVISGYNGALIQSNDEIKLCLNMSHSYLGDLEVMLTSPNGVEVSIFNSFTGTGLFPGGFGGGGTFVGGADDGSSLVGVCEEYCFEMRSTSLQSWASGYNTISSSGPSGGSMVEPATYLPEGDFSSFIGSPIDGNWKLTIRDNLSIDDGWICSWSIELGPTFYSGNWNSSIGLSDSTITNPTFYPSQSTNYQYYYEDSSGSCFDTLDLKLLMNSSTLTTFPISGNTSVNNLSNESYSTINDSTVIYLWSVWNGNIISGQGTNQVEIQWNSSPYDGIVLLNVDNGCNQTSETLNVALGFASINENTNRIKLYPNPTKDGKVYFESIESIEKIEVRNLLGQNLSAEINLQNDLIDLSQLPNGNYILTYYSTKGSINNYKVNLMK